MYTLEEHLDNLIRHINLVRDACILLGKRYIAQGKKDFGRLLIRRGFIHDASKFEGIEWDFLHCGPDVNPTDLQLAIKQHTRTNSHHPEHSGGIENMSPLDLAEMCCDWYARAQEFGTDLRHWVTSEAVSRFNIDLKSEQWTFIQECLSLLVQDSFKRN
jgi:hypothetical protein